MQQPIAERVTDATGEVWSVPNMAKAIDPLVRKPVRLWDCIDQAWTGPMVEDKIYKIYLPKRVIKCSACDYVTFVKHEAHEDLKAGQVALAVGTVGSYLRGHIDLINEQSQVHHEATIGDPMMVDDGKRAVQICTGCGIPFQVGKGMPHIMETRAMSASHQRVEALLMNRFALEPSEPTIFAREVVVAGPEVRQVEADAPPSNGRRRRRRTRGHGRAIRTG